MSLAVKCDLFFHAHDSCGDIQIKRHSKVKYLECLLYETMSAEAMALNVVNKIDSKLNFLYSKNSFLTPL